MATSGSTDFSVNRDDLCKAVLRLCGVIAAEETPEADDIENVSQAMNMMVKAWAGEGIQLFTQKRATLFLQNSKTSYNLGPSGDHATHSYTSTTIRVAEAANETSLEVTTTTGMTAADYIGIILDSGNVHWTTISSVTDSDTVVVASGIPSAAAAGNKVYWYTSKIPRPIKILNAFIRKTNDDYVLDQYTRDMYWEMTRKTWSSRPTAFFYENTLTNGTFYTNYQATDFTETLEFVYHRPFEDFDSAANTPDFPQEWYEALKYNTALRVAPEYDRHDLIQHLAPFALESKMNAKNSTGDNPRYVIPTCF